MDDVIINAENRLRQILIIKNDIRENVKFDSFMELPQEYIDLKQALNKVIDAEYKRINPER